MPKPGDAISDRGDESPPLQAAQIHDERKTEPASDESKVTIRAGESAGTGSNTLSIQDFKIQSASQNEADRVGASRSDQVIATIENALLTLDTKQNSRAFVSTDTLDKLTENESLDSKISIWKAAITQALAKSSTLKEVILLVPAQKSNPDSTEQAMTPALQKSFENIGQDVKELKFKLNQEAVKKHAERLAADPREMEVIQISDSVNRKLKDTGDARAEIVSPASKITLAPEEQKMARFYQLNTLAPQMAFLTPQPELKEGEDPKKAYAEHQKLIEQRVETIKSEEKAGIWGPESQKAFEQYLQKLTESYSSTVKQLQSYGLRLPKDNPLSIPEENGKRISEADFLNRVASGRLSLNIIPDSSKVPRLAEAQKIEDSLTWISKSAEIVRKAENERIAERYTQLIIERKLPKGWLYQEGQDKDAWRAAVGRMLDLTMNVGRKVSLVESLKEQGSYFSTFPLEYPPGTEVTKGKDGRTNIKLDLPATPDLHSEKTKRLLNWDAQSESTVKSAVEQLMKGKENPVAAIAYGDTAVPKFKDPKSGKEISASAIFDTKVEKDGTVTEQLVAFGNPNLIQLKEGQVLKPFNLLEQRVHVEEKSGRIIVSQHTQAQQVPWYSYQNMVYENVGGPASITKQEFKPDDIVAIKLGKSTNYVLASELKAYIDQCELFHYGEKALVASMDLAMLATGTVAVGAAYKGARILAAGVEVTNTLGARQVLFQGAKGSLEMALGITGPSSNAYWTAGEAGRLGNNLRSAAFVTMALPATYQLMARDIPGGLKRALDLAGIRSLTEADKVIQEASAFQQIIQGSGPLMKTTAKVSEQVLGLSQFPMLPMISEGFLAQIRELRSHSDPDDLSGIRKDSNSMIPSKDLFRGSTPNAERPVKESPEALAQSLDSYKNLFLSALRSTGASSTSISQTAEIFDKLRKVLRPNAKEEEKAALAKELIANLTLSESSLTRLRSLTNRTLTDQEIDSLNNFHKRDQVKDKVLSKWAAREFSFNDQNVMAASEIALLYLAKHSDKPINSSFDSTLTIPAQNLPAGKGTLPIGERTAKISLDLDSIAASLKAKLEKMGSDGRGIVTGDILLKVGSYSGSEFGGLLSRVLTNPKSSPQEKLSALLDSTGPRMAASLANAFLRDAQDLQKLQDRTLSAQDRGKLLAARFGLSARDLELSLDKAANEDPNSQVRAASAAFLYGLNSLKSSPENGMRVLSKLSAITKNSTESTIEQRVKQFFMDELTQSKHTDFEQRINLANAISRLSKHLPQAEKQDLEKLAVKSLADSTMYASEWKAQSLFAALTPERLQTLDKTNPDLGNAVRYRLTQLLKPPDKTYNPGQEEILIGLAKQIPQLAAGADEPTRTELFKSTLKVLNQSSEQYSDLRAQLASVLSSIPDQARAATPVLTKLAETDSSASVREAAILGLDKMKEPQFNNLLLRRLESEADVAVLRTLNELASRQSAAEFYTQTSRDLISFQTEIKERYPSIADFDKEKQRAWVLQNHMPLLDRQTFIAKLREGTKDKLGNNFFDTPQSFGDNLAQERELQFQALVDIAKGDASQEPVQKARYILFSMIADNGRGIVGDSQRIYLDTYRSGRTSSPKYYLEANTNWEYLAAAALAKTSDISNTGRDLSARMIAMALASPIKPASKDTLINAWKRFADKDGERKPVPEAVYQYVLSTANKR